MGASTNSEWLTFLAVAATALVMVFLVRKLMRGMHQQDFILLRQAKSKGVDIGKPQRVDFVVFAATTETADELGKLMRDDGFETHTTVAQIAYARNKSKPEQAQEGWLIKGTRTLALTPENLKRHREFLTTIATERKAAYFGWQMAGVIGSAKSEQ